MGSQLLIGTTIKILEMSLNLRAKRHQQIAANIANMDTPGYKPQPMGFEEQLRRIPESVETNALRVTHKRHFPINETNISYTKTGMPSPFSGGGSSDAVNLEEEMTKLAENNLMYNTLARILKMKFDQIRLAIRGGR